MIRGRIRVSFNVRDYRGCIGHMDVYLKTIEDYYFQYVMHTGNFMNAKSGIIFTSVIWHADMCNIYGINIL